MARKINVIVLGNPEIVENFKKLSFKYHGLINYVKTDLEANAIIDISDFDGTTNLEEEVETAMRGIVKIQNVKKSIRKYNNAVKKSKNGSK